MEVDGWHGWGTREMDMSRLLPLPFLAFPTWMMPCFGCTMGGLICHCETKGIIPTAANKRGQWGSADSGYLLFD